MPVINGPAKSESLDFVHFTKDSVLNKLRSLKEGKSPGPDGFSVSVLKKCANSLADPLSVLFNQSIDTGILPLDWKTALITPVYKKGDKLDADNYRPISLTSLVVKVMESIIYDNMIAFLMKHNVIPPAQHGFLPGKSINTNLLTSLADWTRALDTGDTVDVVYFDFSKAFDRVPKRRLLFKLDHYGIRGNFLRWIDSFLTDRSFRIRIGNSVSVPVKVLSGVPQGSLFIVYSSDITNGLRSKCAMYADDVKLYNSSSNCMILSNDITSIHT